MTGIAVIANRRDATDGLQVTVLAVQLDMRACQREICLSIMIESPGPPIRRVVAVIALIAQAATMRVIVDMARRTHIVRVVISRRRVASVACNFGVGTKQWKARDVMIEPHARRPTGRHVAACATITKLTIVHVVRGMTRTTILRQRNGETVGMASVASEVPMSGWQRKSGLRSVIEQYRIPVE